MVLLSAVEPELKSILTRLEEVIAFSVTSVLWWHVGRAKELLDRQPTHVRTEKPLRWLAKSSTCVCTDSPYSYSAGWVNTVSGSGYKGKRYLSVHGKS